MADRRTKVAIVGFSHTTRDQAPFKDESFEIWGLGSLYREIPRHDRWFEMHTDEHLKLVHKDTLPQFQAWLAGLKVPLYMQEADPRYPSSIRYPIERASEAFFPGLRPYWTNTMAYMVALALLEDFKEIHVYGVDMAHKEEYVIQRPGVTYLLGIAVGRGVKVFLPEKCALMHSRTVYGYEEQSTFLEEEHAVLIARRDAYLKQHEEHLASLHNLDGRTAELNELIVRNEEQQRGGTW